MANRNRFIIQNDESRSIIVNIEPESVQYSLASGETITIKDSFDEKPVTLKVESDRGETIISVWPGDGEVRVEKDGVDIFDLIEKTVRAQILVSNSSTTKAESRRD